MHLLESARLPAPTEPAEQAKVMARAAQVRLMVFDVDGILTDGSLHFGADGEAMKRFNVLDGFGIKLLQQNGIVTAIVSARNSPIVMRRASELGIDHIVQGAHDKHSAFKQLWANTGIDAQASGFIGDDWLDLPALLRVGFAATVPQAHPEVRSKVQYVTQAAGGYGAVREVCDLILRAQGKYDAALARYLL